MQITKNHFVLPLFLLISISIQGTGEAAALAALRWVPIYSIPSIQRVGVANVFKHPGKAVFHQLYFHKLSLYSFYYQWRFMVFLCAQAQRSGVTGGSRTPGYK